MSMHGNTGHATGRNTNLHYKLLEYLRSRKTMPTMDQMVDRLGKSHCTIRSYLRLLEAEYLISRENQRVSSVRVTKLGQMKIIPTTIPTRPRKRRNHYGSWTPKGGTLEERIEAIVRREEARLR